MRKENGDRWEGKASCLGTLGLGEQHRARAARVFSLTEGGRQLWRSPAHDCPTEGSAGRLIPSLRQMGVSPNTSGDSAALARGIGCEPHT